MLFARFGRSAALALAIASPVFAQDVERIQIERPAAPPAAADPAAATATPAPAPAVAATPEQKKEIEQLIAQLSSTDEAARKAALEKLVSMGDVARAALEEHVRARQAAETALLRLDSDKAAGATLITLDLKDQRADRAFAELSKALGAEIAPYNTSMWSQVNLPRITASFEKKPFWEVMREICVKTDITLYNSGGNERRIQVIPVANFGGRNAMKYPANIQGAFYISVTHLQRTNSVDMANPETINRNVSMQLQVYAEPKVRVIQYSYQPDIEEAVDDKGNSLLPESARRTTFRENMGSGRGVSWNMSANFVYPKDPGAKISKLRGKLRFIVQTRSEAIEVPDIMQAKELTKTAGGRRATIKDLKKNGTNYILRVALHRDNMEQQAFYDMVNNPSIKLLDANDREYSFSGVNSSTGGADQYEMQMTFYRRGGNGNVNLGEPVKLVWEIPTGTQEITIPFEFTDLPLP